MSIADEKHDAAQIEALIEVWRTLEVLTVSLDRMGSYWRIHGEEAAKDALHQFMGPAMNEQIAIARTTMVQFLETLDPTMYGRLEAMAQNEKDIGYWNGPK